MSGPAINWAFEQVKNLNDPSEKLVLIRLAWRANDENKCWPGHDLTAADLNIHRRSVQRAVKNLEKIGLIYVEKRPNDTSHFTLQVNFSLSVGDIVSPQTETKNRSRVTPSHPGGDLVSPPGVPPCHPNKTMNKTMNKQPQPPVVVVCEIIWEKPLTVDEKQSCEQVLAGRVDAQKFADELAGAGRVRPISNPAGWMRAVVKNSLRPNFCFEHAERVASARAGRLAQAQRESLVLPPDRLAGVTAPAPRELTTVGRAALAALGRHPKTSPPVGKHQTPVPPGATSANMVPTSTPAAAPP